MKRRLFLATSVSAALSACSSLGTKLNENAGFHRVLESAEGVNLGLIGTRGRARLYSERDVSADFPINSLPTPGDATYADLARTHFRNYSLIVDGLVDRPQRFTLTQLEHLSDLRQITRHDCVEGWSVVAKWDGVRLGTLLALVSPKTQARYAVFHSFDTDDNGTPYYESLSLEQAAHPQTMLSLRQNGKPIEIDRGAPVRLTVPTQLGYKSAKWVRRIEVVASLRGVLGGKGGYWEDQGYEWYAGI